MNSKTQDNQLLTLYTTEGCHLCEQALQMLEPWLQQGYGLAKVDIAEDELLMARYGERIPVVASRCGMEIGWPFSAQELTQWIKQL